MNSAKREKGQKSGAPLSADLVLAVNPKVTFRWSAKTVEADNRTRQVSGGSDESVGLSTLRAEERTLLALADGKRSIEALAQLAGMTNAVAAEHLRSLRDRGILVSAADPVTPDPPEPVTERSGDLLAPPGITDALMRGPVEYDYSAVFNGAGDETAKVEGNQGVQDNDFSGEVNAPVSTVPAEPTPAEPPQPKKSGSGPNATLWWIPRPVLAKSNAEEPSVPSEQNGPEATVVVFGSSPPAPPARAESSPVSTTTSEAAPASEAASGTTFRVGAYEVAMRIAQGAMGSIYVCRRTDSGALQRLYTLKVIRQHASQTEVAIRSFAREARIGGLLNHPNLQGLVDIGTYQNQPFLILDYVEGTSLADLLLDARKPPPSVVVPIILDLLRGLQYVHEVVDQQGINIGLVHADVSPQNVLVGVDGAARLTDFGSARHPNEPEAGETDPVTVGKPAFMAPEQLLGEAIDARTDLFSLGAVMWTALTGQGLFAAETYDQTVMKVLRRKIPPPSEFGGPPSLDAIVLRALSRSPEGRYASAEEMARELLDAAAADRLVATPSEVGQWVRREFGETLADRRRKIQEAFGAASRVQDSQPIKAHAPRPHRVTPKTVDGFEKIPTRTVQIDAVSIAQAREAMASSSSSRSARSAAPASSAGHRPRSRPPARNSRTQWILVVLSAVFAACALGLAIAYFVSSLNTPPRRVSPDLRVDRDDVRPIGSQAPPVSPVVSPGSPGSADPPGTRTVVPRGPRDTLPGR